MQKIVKTNKLLSILFFVIIIGVYSCRKYDDNPALGYVRTKNFLDGKSYYFKNLFVNEIDSTQRLLNDVGVKCYCYFLIEEPKYKWFKKNKNRLTENEYSTGWIWKGCNYTASSIHYLSLYLLHLIWKGCNYTASSIYNWDKQNVYMGTIEPSTIASNLYLSYFGSNTTWKIKKMYKTDLWFEINKHGKVYFLKLEKYKK